MLNFRWSSIRDETWTFQASHIKFANWLFIEIFLWLIQILLYLIIERLTSFILIDPHASDNLIHTPINSNFRSNKLNCKRYTMKLFFQKEKNPFPIIYLSTATNFYILTDWKFQLELNDFFMKIVIWIFIDFIYSFEWLNNVCVLANY